MCFVECLCDDTTVRGFQGMSKLIKEYLQRVMAANPLVVGVELLLIGLVVWWVMRFLRGTRGARLVKGVAVLLVGVYVVIRLLPEELRGDRLVFLSSKFLWFAFIAVVVAFQPELRRVLIQIGQARLFRGVRGEVEAMVEELADASGYLSRNKIGAILAVERSVGLGAIIETGSVLDANLSASMLKTIFYPGGALHDMGVIIRDGRIAAAGCQFPLAESGEVDPSLGSRHRAALGLARDSDAVVLVVSEETGRVSLACEGQLYLGLETENLREMLVALLAPKHFLRRRRRQQAKSVKAE